MSRPTLADINPRYLPQIEAQLKAGPRPRTIAVQPATDQPAKKRIRQNSAGLNKTEAAFFEYLKAEFPDCANSAQSITFKLGNGVRYTPDFTSIRTQDDRPRDFFVFEVKGHMRDDAAVKLKVAASMYPWAKFHLVTRAKSGAWDVQEVLP